MEDTLTPVANYLSGTLTTHTHKTQIVPKNHFALIREWAVQRNLIAGAKPNDQMLKLMEEVGELARDLGKNNQKGIADAIGDCVVVLTILASQKGMHIEDCIELAYNEIKDRKGRMVNGLFVKEDK